MSVDLENAIVRFLETDNGSENVTDIANLIAYEIRQVANAITPSDASPYRDDKGGVVASLTEAVIGVSEGIQSVADAIEHLAEAVENKGKGA